MISFTIGGLTYPVAGDAVSAVNAATRLAHSEQLTVTVSSEHDVLAVIDPRRAQAHAAHAARRG
jgi:hypothetical protein